MSNLTIDPTKVIDHHGWCARFCIDAIIGEHPDNGTPLDQHGDFCFGATLSGYGEFGGTRLWIAPAAPYFHGQRTVADAHHAAALERRCAVALFINDGAEPALLLSAGDARALAADLVYVADVRQRIDRPHAQIKRRFDI